MPLESRKQASRAVVLAASLSLSACSLHNVERDPVVPLAAPVPERFEELTTDGDTFTERWWTLFGADELTTLIDHALTDNLDIRRALARIRQAEAFVRTAESGRLPTLQAQAGAAGSRSVFDLGRLGVQSNEAANFNLGLGAAYEVDIWNRIGHGIDAATLDVQATREDLQALSLTLAGLISDTYLLAVGERALLDLLSAQEVSAAKVVELVELRFGQGLAAIVEVYQQRQQLATLRAQRPLSESRLAIFRHQLATLLGRPPSALSLADVRQLPSVPAPPRAGLPAEVLLRRPDVRASLLRVTAADHRVGSAIAAQYPALNLSASTGFQSPDLADLFERWVWGLAANLVAPLFDGGRRSAEVQRTEAVVNELVMAYGQTTLTALTEVESALAQESRQRQHIERLEDQLALANLGFAEAQSRYLNGLANYLEVLTAQRTLQQSEQTMLQARRQLLSFRVQLHRALGGTWMASASSSPATTAPSQSPPRGAEPARGIP